MTFQASIEKFRLAAVFSVVVLVSHAGAQPASVVDDFEDGSNQNHFLGYWFYYNDAADGGTSVVSSSLPSPLATGELLFDSSVSVGPGNAGSALSGKLEFTYGQTKPTCGVGCTYGQFVGMGTTLIPEGQVIDLTGATAISFWAKASAPMTVRMEVATATVTNFGYHRAEPLIGTSWELHVVPLVEGPGFKQPAWAVAEQPVAFDPSQVQKIQWAISSEDNLGLVSGTMWIDDVVVHNYTWVPPSACMACVGVPGLGTGALLSDMELDPFTRNALGFHWYVYNDAEGRAVASQADYTEIFGGVTPNVTDPTLPLINILGNGNPGNGAFIQFTLGPSYTEGANVVKPFAGIGTKLSDNLGVNFFDATGSQGVSFDYNTTGDINFIRLEVKANRTYPNPGIVHHALLPATGGIWASASVPWTSLVLPDWAEVAQILDKSLYVQALEKFQWAYQGEPGQTGTIAVDNVKIMGLLALDSTLVKPNSIFQPGPAVLNGLQIQHVDGNLAFNVRTTSAFTVTLTDVAGREVAQASSVPGEGGQRALVPTSRLHRGMYLLRVRDPRGDILAQARMPWTD